MHSFFEGGCTCRSVRYRLEAPPLFVNCCHCRWCQRETGSAFVINVVVESERVANLALAPELIQTPSESGLGQQIARCPRCHVAVWSHYPGAGPFIKFVRVGSLDEPDGFPPGAHIFTASKQPWVVLPPGTPAFAEYYEREEVWPALSLERWRTLLPLVETYRAGLSNVA